MTNAGLFSYCENMCAAFSHGLKDGIVFAKLLTANDDAGRHGVLVPSEAYDFFPLLLIPHADSNETVEFHSYDVVGKRELVVAFKYYQRYPERRVTRLSGKFNNAEHGPPLAIFLKARDSVGITRYYVDCLNRSDVEYHSVIDLIFGSAASVLPGRFIVRNIDSPTFSYDSPLTDFVQHFDRVREMGWIESLRTGDTGIGYTFETLIGIEENNNQDADYKGIEVKCKQKKEGQVSSGKINLFQKGPTWRDNRSAKERIKHIGYLTDEMRYSCHSQLTTLPNNLDLKLLIQDSERRIDLRKSAEVLGDWTYNRLEKSLLKKHARAVFVKADVRKTSKTTHFRYDELVYCERPTIQNFVALIESRQLVFEFMMSQKENGSVRNHGYPWRLNREDLLKHLYALRIQLR
jgi:hypothetical protein